MRRAAEVVASVMLVALTVAFFEAFSRSGAPLQARRPLTSLTVREHLAEAWKGAVLLGRIHQRGRPDHD